MNKASAPVTLSESGERMVKGRQGQTLLLGTSLGAPHLMSEV